MAKTKGFGLDAYKNTTLLQKFESPNSATSPAQGQHGWSGN